MTSPFLLLNYFVGRKDRCETTKHKTEKLTEELGDTESQTLDLMLLKFLSNALQLNL